MSSRCIPAIVALVVLLNATAVAEQPVQPGTSIPKERRISFNIPSQPMAQALDLLGQQADLSILFTQDDVSKLVSREVKGVYTVAEALRKLLKHTDLDFKRVDATTVTVKKRNQRKLTRNHDESVPKQDAGSDLVNVVITGTRLDNQKAADSSAKRAYDEDALEQSGVASLAEFARVIPESFNSVSPVPSLFGNTVGASQLGNNQFLGSGFNLSGLGPEATLTLLDGDRLVSGGASGTFLDLALLPLSAIGGIVILTGDTSAVYGPDAIAGVVNILSRPGTEGSETRVRYGMTSDGGGAQRVFSQRLGGSWQEGNGMIAYERTEQSPVLAATRRFIPVDSPAIDIVPRQSSSSLLGKLEQRFEEGTSVRAHFLYGARDIYAESRGLGGYVVKRDSPVDEYGGTVHIDHRLTPEWTIGLYGSYSTLAQSLTTTAPGVPPVGQPGNSSLGEFALSANAEPLTWLGRSVRLAFGAGGRKETLTVPTALYNASSATLSRKVGDLYVETLFPLTSRSYTLLERLELSLAAREDYYEALGHTFNPKVGLVWSPVSDLSVRASFARSFRPPTLDELAAIPLYYTVKIDGVTDTLVNQSQGMSRLEPETARTITSGLDYRRDRSEGLTGSLTWFRTIFDNRIAAPLIGSVGPTSDIFAHPELAPYISRSINPDRIQAIFASPPAVLQDPVGAGPGAVMATFDNEPTNIARTLQEGLEVSLRYSRGEKPRQVGAFMIASYLLRDMYRSTPGAPTMSLMNNIGQVPNLRTRAGVTGSRDHWRATLNANYTNGYQNTLVSPAEEVESWTTLDFQLAYQLPVSADVKSMQLTLNARNFLNTTPPRIALPDGLSLRPVGFDAANASPFRRMLSLDLSVAW